jgi:two-component system OmpR family response regulator
MPETPGALNSTAVEEIETVLPNKVLVVDDDDDLARALTIYFLLAGFEVVSAANGERALREINTAPPDAVILDIRMPGMDGLSLCRQLRNGNGHGAIPLVIFSGLTGHVWRREALDSGADEFFAKPCSFDKIRDAVSRLISERAST